MVPADATSPHGRKELAGLFPPWNPSLRTWVTHGKASPKSLQLGWETFKWSPNPSSCIKEEQNISASVFASAASLSPEEGRVKAGSYHHSYMASQ